jgi:mRNA interferase MazF
VKRGEIYRTSERIAERGDKPGFYLIVSRTFVAANSDISTVVCTPIYSEILGLNSELVLGPEEGLPHASAVRCDFLMLLFKRRLTDFISTLGQARQDELDNALKYALEIQ